MIGRHRCLFGLLWGNVHPLYNRGDQQWLIDKNGDIQVGFRFRNKFFPPQRERTGDQGIFIFSFFLRKLSSQSISLCSDSNCCVPFSACLTFLHFFRFNLYHLLGHLHTPDAKERLKIYVAITLVKGETYEDNEQ